MTCGTNKLPGFSFMNKVVSGPWHPLWEIFRCYQCVRHWWWAPIDWKSLPLCWLGLHWLPTSLLPRYPWQHNSSQAGFMLTSLIGLYGSAIAVIAIFKGMFWLFTGGAILMGTFNGCLEYESLRACQIYIKGLPCGTFYINGFGMIRIHDVVIGSRSSKSPGAISGTSPCMRFVSANYPVVRCIKK